MGSCGVSPVEGSEEELDEDSEDELEEFDEELSELFPNRLQAEKQVAVIKIPHNRAKTFFNFIKNSPYSIGWAYYNSDLSPCQ